MKPEIPSASVIREHLSGMTTAALRELAAVSDVPFTTLWKVRSGETENPGIETVRKFYDRIPPQALANSANPAPNSIAPMAQEAA